VKRVLGNFTAVILWIFISSALAEVSLDGAIADLSSGDPDKRRIASELLIAAGSKAVPPLIQTLESGHSSATKEAALILGAIGDARAVKPLVAVLEDRDADLRWAAIWALVRIGSPSVADLINSFENSQADANAGAEIALAKIGKPAVPQLISALDNKNARVRRHCARLLGRIGDPKSAPALKNLLQDQNEDVRNEAAIALTKITEE
jgi:HEAT repeat protein